MNLEEKYSIKTCRDVLFQFLCDIKDNKEFGGSCTLLPRQRRNWNPEREFKQVIDFNYTEYDDDEVRLYTGEMEFWSLDIEQLEYYCMERKINKFLELQ